MFLNVVYLQECLSCNLLGSIMRSSTDRVVSLFSDSTSNYIGCHVSSLLSDRLANLIDLSEK